MCLRLELRLCFLCCADARSTHCGPIAHPLRQLTSRMSSTFLVIGETRVLSMTPSRLLGMLSYTMVQETACGQRRVSHRHGVADEEVTSARNSNNPDTSSTRLFCQYNRRAGMYGRAEARTCFPHQRTTVRGFCMIHAASGRNLHLAGIRRDDWRDGSNHSRG